MKREFKVVGMKCEGCVQNVHSAVQQLDGIHDVQVSLNSGTLTVVTEDDIEKSRVEKAVTQAGFRLE